MPDLDNLWTTGNQNFVDPDLRFTNGGDAISRFDTSSSKLRGGSCWREAVMGCAEGNVVATPPPLSSLGPPGMIAAPGTSGIPATDEN